MKREGARVILTPEHVQVELTPAGLGSRFLALLLDSLFAFGLSAFLATILALVPPAGFAYAIWVTTSFLITSAYHVYFETYHQGRSPGKKLVGLRVVDGLGLPISLEQSFVRNVVRFLDAVPLFYGVGGLACLLDSRRRRLGDVAADTLVIREGRSSDPGRRLWLSREFNSLMTPRVLRFVRHRVTLEEREFLLTLCLRSGDLEDKARFDLMGDVARHYRRTLEIDDTRLSDENLIRGLTALAFPERTVARFPRTLAAKERV